MKKKPRRIRQKKKLGGYIPSTFVLTEMEKTARVLIIACILVAWGGGAVTGLETSSPSASPGPQPSGDCSEVIYNLSDCLDFLSKGSNHTKPGSNCCSGFESVVKSNFHCICEAIKSSSDLGLDLNLTRAFTLSSDCAISAPPLNKCGGNFILYHLLVRM